MFKRRLLLGFNTNAKTVKGEKIGYYTGILYLAPSDLSGYQVCSMAKLALCEKPCLFTSGRGAFNSIRNARIAKTKYFFEDRNNFMVNICKDIEKGIKKAKLLNQQLLIRLNGTSDIKWENIDFEYNGIQYNNVMECFPNVQFYDYTKIPNRVNLPSNYDITFSYSNAITFHKYNDIAIKNKNRIAVVFRHEENIPKTFKGLSVIGGDNSDVRHIEEKNVIVALYAKGRGKKDYSGFIVD
jgi:hypothetical protein